MDPEIADQQKSYADEIKKLEDEIETTKNQPCDAECDKSYKVLLIIYIAYNTILSAICTTGMAMSKGEKQAPKNVKELKIKPNNKVKELVKDIKQITNIAQEAITNNKIY